MNELVIGSRGSKLALWQSEWVAARLAELEPSVRVRVEVVRTTGDVMRDAPLSAIGGQGAFTKELEHALLEGRVDVAVHSLKDLPTFNPERLSLAAVPPREDARDALVLRAGAGGREASLAGLPRGAAVGTSSPRRAAQLRRVRPDVSVKELRGNVDTRLRKLDAGEYDAIILAAAGLRRLGLADRISAALDAGEMVPAVSQGALGVQTRADAAWTNALVSRLDHAPTRAACEAERAFLRGLGGGCQVPVAAHAVADGANLSLTGLVVSPSGESALRDTAAGEVARAAELGRLLAARMTEQGAAGLLAGAGGAEG